MATTSPFVQVLNPGKAEAIVLLHGLFSSWKEYATVIPYLGDYTLIVPDLPGHSRSSSIALSTLSDLADLVAQLIEQHASNGQAHIAGLSFGGYIALAVAAKYPSKVLSMFITGCSQSMSGFIGTIAPYTAYGFTKPFYFIPGALSWAMSFYGITSLPEGYEAELYSNASFANAKAAYGLLAREHVSKPVTARTLCCGGSSGDMVGQLKGQQADLKKGNAESRAVVAKGMLHAWDLQAPELFANTVKAWITQQPLPEGIIPLDEWFKK